MTVKLTIVNTGPTPAGWSKAALITQCPQKFAWTYLSKPPPVAALIDRVPVLDIDLDAEPEAASLLVAPKLTGTDEEPVPVDADAAPAEALIRGTLIHVAFAHFYELLRRGQRASMAGTEPPATSVRVPLALKVPAAHVIVDSAADVPVIVSPSNALEEAIGQFEDDWPDCTAGIRQKVRTAVRAYIGYYADDADRWEVLGVEVHFREQVKAIGIDGVERSAPFTQRIDLIVRNRADGLIYYADHKSTYRIDTKVKRRYTLSGQFLAMRYFGALRHGAEFGGVLTNLIGLNPIAFARPPQEPAPFRLTRWARDYVYTQRLQDVLLKTYGLDPRDWPGVDSETACYTAYGECPFFERCRWGK